MASSPVARDIVRQLLQSSAAYRALPADRRREIARHTVHVATYMADPQGLLSRSSATAPSTGQPSSAAAPYIAALCDPRVHDAAAAAMLVLQTIAFPRFVASLIDGVFNAIVGSSIRQMEAYASMVSEISKAVDQFMQDDDSDARARDRLVQRFPAQIGAGPRGRLRWLVDPAEGACIVARALRLIEPVTDLRALVAAARRRAAIERQLLLATMVTMGLQSIVGGHGQVASGADRE